MRNGRLAASAIAACCVAILAMVPARADQLDDIMQAKKIRISTDLAIPPDGMVDANMKPTGSDVEVAQLLAKDWGLELEFVQTTGATRIPNVLTGKADIIISTLSITSERAKVIDFSRRYATLESDIGCLKSLNVKDWADLKGKTVGVSRGTTQDTTLTNMKDKEFSIARYDDDATNVTSAVSGQIDCIGSSLPLIIQVGVKNPDRVFESKIPLTIFDLAIGLKKSEPRLLEKLNAWIADNIKNGKLNAIYKKFHGVDLPPDMRG
jgi:polar amino acid transport system substrate-binding protein